MLYKMLIFLLNKTQKLVFLLKKQLTLNCAYDMLSMLGRLSEWPRFLQIPPLSSGLLSTSPWKRFKIQKILVI